MSRREHITKELLVEPGTAANITGRDPAWTGGPEFQELSATELSHTAKALLADGVKVLARSQELLWASNTGALLVVFQAMDAAGKDGTIKHVMSGVNPQGCQVFRFKQPSSEELDHNFLWRTSRRCLSGAASGSSTAPTTRRSVGAGPPRAAGQAEAPDRRARARFWAGRYEDINAFERHLVRNGTSCKFFLNVSKGSRSGVSSTGSRSPTSTGSSRAADLEERARWDDYMRRSRRRSRATHPWAPWYVIPADHKPVMQAMVAAILVDTIESMELSWPEVSEQAQVANAEARRKLAAEPEDETG